MKTIAMVSYTDDNDLIDDFEFDGDTVFLSESEGSDLIQLSTPTDPHLSVFLPRYTVRAIVMQTLPDKEEEQTE